MKHLTRQKTEDTFWETKQLIVQLGFVTPRLFLQFRDYNPSINDKEEEEAIRGELDVFIEPLQLIRRDPSRDLAMIDLGPYYFMERGLSAMHPPVQSKQIHPEFKSEPGKTYLLDPKQPLDRANFYRYYLGARFICQHVQDGNLDGYMVGDPLFVRMDSQTAIYLEADWTYTSLPKDGPVNHLFLENRNWSTDQVSQYLEEVSTYSKAYTTVAKSYLAYPDRPWLYTKIILVHTQAGQREPEHLARAFTCWRQAAQEFEFRHGYPMMIGVTHEQDLLAGKRLVDAVYDLAGYC